MQSSFNIKKIKENIVARFNSNKNKTENWLNKSSNTGALANLLVIAALLVIFIIFIAFSILIISITYNIFTPLVESRISPFNIMGPFGDFIGGFLNPVLTFLMFMGVLVTIVIQSKELKETRKEIKNQAESNKEHVKILKREESRKQLIDAFNEARDRYWELSKEKMSSYESVYDLILYGQKLPPEKHYEIQLKYINRKLNTLTSVATQLLPQLTKPVQDSIICEIEDIYTFAIEAKISSEEDMKLSLENLDKIIAPEKQGGGIVSRIMKELFKAKPNDNN